MYHVSWIRNKTIKNLYMSRMLLFLLLLLNLHSMWTRSNTNYNSCHQLSFLGCQDVSPFSRQCCQPSCATSLGFALCFCNAFRTSVKPTPCVDPHPDLHIMSQTCLFWGPPSLFRADVSNAPGSKALSIYHNAVPCPLLANRWNTL